jgi:hypothetical protein
MLLIVLIIVDHFLAVFVFQKLMKVQTLRPRARVGSFFGWMREVMCFLSFLVNIIFSSWRIVGVDETIKDVSRQIQSGYEVDLVLKHVFTSSTSTSWIIEGLLREVHVAGSLNLNVRKQFLGSLF